MLTAPMNYQTMESFGPLDLVGCGGAIDGERLSSSEHLSLGDRYVISPDAKLSELTLASRGASPYFTAVTGDAGVLSGALVSIDSCLKFMDARGAMFEALLLKQWGRDGEPLTTLSPLSSFSKGECYCLVSIDHDCALKRLAEDACLSFAEGTKITLADGTSLPVEKLSAGDMIATRDNGSAPLLWTGASLVRACAKLSPVRLKAHHLSNTRDLLLAPHQLIIMEPDCPGRVPPKAKAPATMEARELLRGDGARTEPVNFLNYFYLLLDKPQVIYAENLPVMSLAVTASTRAAIPTEILAKIPGASAPTPPHVATQLASQQPRMHHPLILR